MIQDPDQVTERDLDGADREVRRIIESLDYQVKVGDRDDKNIRGGDKCPKCCGTHKERVKCWAEQAKCFVCQQIVHISKSPLFSKKKKKKLRKVEKPETE